jgi:hypothetical protein
VRWLLFDDAALAFALGASGGAGGCDFAGLHKLSDVPVLCKPLDEEVCLSEVAAKTYDWRNLLPPSSFSCSDFTISTRSTICNRLCCRALACLAKAVSSGVQKGLGRGKQTPTPPYTDVAFGCCLHGAAR